ncbi:MAG: hypothetical protein LBU60_04730 [Clostridiales bacterium]|jgi:nitrate reductase NapE component|nr:hypothetical protein [Clostridiales bacterium]
MIISKRSSVATERQSRSFDEFDLTESTLPRQQSQSTLNQNEWQLSEQCQVIEFDAGFDSLNSTNTVEFYNPNSQIWTDSFEQVDDSKEKLKKIDNNNEILTKHINLKMHEAMVTPKRKFDSFNNKLNSIKKNKELLKLISFVSVIFAIVVVAIVVGFFLRVKPSTMSMQLQSKSLASMSLNQEVQECVEFFNSAQIKL